MSASIAALLAGGAALAEAADSDGDGVYSLEEMTAAYPDMTEDLFGEIDADGDGFVSPEELTDAQEVGIVGG